MGTTTIVRQGCYPTGQIAVIKNQFIIQGQPAAAYLVAGHQARGIAINPVVAPFPLQALLVTIAGCQQTGARQLRRIGHAFAAQLLIQAGLQGFAHGRITVVGQTVLGITGHCVTTLVSSRFGLWPAT